MRDRRISQLNNSHGLCASFISGGPKTLLVSLRNLCVALIRAKKMPGRGCPSYLLAIKVDFALSEENLAHMDWNLPVIFAAKTVYLAEEGEGGGGEDEA
jgi:hypothetical protein